MTPAEEERLRFYAALGLCIAQWSHVEDALASVFSEAMSGRSLIVTWGAFYAIQSPETKIDATNAAVAMRLHNGALLNAWQRLFNHAHRKRKRRNNIAHFQVLIYPKEPEGRRYILRPMLLDPNNVLRYPDRPPPKLYCNDLEVIAATFSTLSTEITIFAYLLGRHLGQRELDQALEDHPHRARVCPIDQTPKALPFQHGLLGEKFQL